MVNPGAFRGSRKAFLEACIPGYFNAVKDGSGPEYLQTTVRRYLKRYPVDLPENEEPSEEELSAVNDLEACEKVYSPTRDPEETEESFTRHVVASEEQKKETKAKIDQIGHWFKYRFNKQNDGVMKGEPHPLNILLANLAGVPITKPGRMRTAHNVWGKEHQELINELLAERQDSKGGNESGEESSSSGDDEGGRTRKKKGKGKKKAKKFVRKGEEAYLAVRQEITIAEFAKLPEEVQLEWKARAKEEHKARLEKWKAVQKAKFSTSPEDRQRCIDRLVKFMQPILDGVSKATGWPCTFIAGGPEPADAGHLNILSIHSGTTTGAVPMTFGAACRPAFKKYCIPIFTAFLQMCFSMEESKSRSLVNTDMLSLRSQLAEQREETTATVDQVDMSNREDFIKEISDMLHPEPKEPELVKEDKGKGKGKEKQGEPSHNGRLL
ncbi:SERTA domain-containing protein 3 [Marasmius crinis-equi]|uniref:SERTA domain-containing protein 3 n=1 Tax=Marasmius crinis-equi TaxID=585013 RepID=A0ABR3EWG5_9AGAR